MGEELQVVEKRVAQLEREVSLLKRGFFELRLVVDQVG